MESDNEDEESYATSSDTIDVLLETQDCIISDLRDEVEILKARIDNLKAVIFSNLPYHLNCIIEST